MSYCTWQNDEYYRDHFEKGMYKCAHCHNPLFLSEAKFEHSSELPAFSQTISNDNINKKEETGGVFKVSCKKCGLDLGREYLNKGPNGSSRFSISSDSLHFVPKKG